MKDRWSQLSLKDKSDLMSLYIKNGISSLEEIKKHYNSYQVGGPVSEKTPNFVQRFNEGNKRDIPFQGGHATHLLSYAERDGKYYVYPEVQPTDYNNSNNPLQYYGRDWRVAFDRAYDNNDYLEFDTEEAARNYSENYKKIPSTGAVLNGRNRGNYNILDYMRGYATGGSIEDKNVHKYQIGGFVRKVAHAVNEHGNKVSSPLSKEDWKYNNYNIKNVGAQTILRNKVKDLYKSRFGSNYIEDKNTIKTFQSLKEEIINKEYRDYLSTFKGDTNASNAALLSVLGTTIGLIPHPVLKIAGAVATIPDQIYDWAAAIDEPKPSNAAHVTVDYLPYLGKLIPGKLDDVAFGVLSGAGNVDDATSSSGKDLFEILNQKANGGSLGKVTPYGQWQYPHQVTTIPSNNITMKGVDYPVLGISNTGDTKVMMPNLDYLFEGQYVTEYPVHKFQRGGQHIPYEAKAKLSEDIMTQIWMPGYKRKYRDDVLLQAGPMQASFLLSGSDKDRYMLEHGYIKGQEGDYGLVKKAIGDNSYPIYQTAKDDEYRENLIPIANIMASDSHNWWGQETAKLRHAGSYPTTLYIDGRNPEKFYQKAWDLNDYGSTRGTKSKMNLTGTLKANILDLIGNPAVQTSGYSRIDIDNLTSHHKPSTKQRVLQKHFEDYLKDKNLTREVLEDGTILYAHPEVTVVGYKD